MNITPELPDPVGGVLSVQTEGEATVVEKEVTSAQSEEEATVEKEILSAQPEEDYPSEAYLLNNQ